MASSKISKHLIGHSIHHKNYGEGIVSDFFIKDDGKFYIAIVFTSHDSEKTFLATTAFSNNMLWFDNPDLNQKVFSICNESEDSKQELSDFSKSSFTTISKNNTINQLIDKVLHSSPIALDLISLFADEEFENELYQEAFLYLEKSITGANLSLAHKSCVVCALSFIALKYYNGDLHSHIEDLFRKHRKDTESQYSYSQIRRGVYTACGIFRERTKYFDLNSYVAVPIILSCVPHYRVLDLFKIAYAIYKQKLLYDENLSDKQILGKVVETFNALRRKDLVSDSDTIKGTNYLMSKYTQSCIYSGFGIDTLSQIVTHCIRLIISYLTLPEDTINVEPYYLDGYTAWTSLFDEDEKERNKYESNRMVSQPYLKLIGTSVHLFTGEYSMDDSYNPNDVHICVYSGDHLIKDQLITNPNAIKFDDDSMGGFVIQRQEIVLPGSPLGELSYTIICEGQQLYHSKSRLSRQCLFFDGKGHEITNGSDYSGSLYVITSRSNTDEYGESIKELFHGDGYIISTIEVNNHEVFYFDGDPYIFYKVTTAKIISYSIPWAEFISIEKSSYPIYSNITIMFPASCTEEELCVEIDGNSYYYDDYFYDNEGPYFTTRFFSKERGEMWVYSIKIFRLVAGYHSIRILNSSHGKQIKGASFNIIYDPFIRREFISKDTSAIYYRLSGSFIDPQTLPFEYGTEQKQLRIFVKNLGYGNLIIFPSSISYSIDGSKWYDLPSKLYFCDIPERTQVLQICGPQKMTAYYIAENSPIERQVINLTPINDSLTKYNFYLSFFRTLVQNEKANIAFSFGNRMKYTTIWYNPYVLRDACNFYFDEQSETHRFEIHFEGNSKVKVSINDLYSEKNYATAVIRSGETIELKESDIDSNVRALSVRLHGKKYGSLFDPFNSEPFFRFPKYEIRPSRIRLTSFPPPFTAGKGRVSGKIDFEGSERILAQIIPSGFNTPVYSKTIKSGTIFFKDIALFPFRSYKLCLYAPVESSQNTYEEHPFYTSPPLKVDSPFLHQTFKISSFILKDGKKLNIDQRIRINKIEEINHKYYMIASIMEFPSKKISDGFAITIKEASLWTYEMIIRRRIKDRFMPVKFSNGKVLDRIIVNKNED